MNSLDISAQKVSFTRSKQLKGTSRLRKELEALAKINYYKKDNVKQFFDRVKKNIQIRRQQSMGKFLTGYYFNPNSRQNSRESFSSMLTDDSTDYRVINSQKFQQRFLLELHKGKTVEQIEPPKPLKILVKKLNFQRFQSFEQRKDENDHESYIIQPISSRFTLAVDYGVKF